MPRTADVSDNWSIETKQTKLGEMTTATNDEDGVSIVVKEYPNGVVLRLQEPANLPGGYDVVADREYNSVESALDELEPRASHYDDNAEWGVKNPPAIQ